MAEDSSLTAADHLCLAAGSFLSVELVSGILGFTFWDPGFRAQTRVRITDCSVPIMSRVSYGRMKLGQLGADSSEKLSVLSFVGLASICFLV
jgi:hypothetical protein